MIQFRFVAPRNYSYAFYLALAFWLILAVGAVPTMAQQISVPSSADTIRGTVVVPDGTEFDFSVLNGGTLRIEEADGRAYGLVMTLPAEGETGDVTNRVFEIKPGAPGEEKVTYVEDSMGGLFLSDRYPQVVSGLDGYLIQITSIRKSTHKSRQPALPEYLGDTDFFTRGTCCVTCGSSTVCGCEVTSSCGSCSAGCGGGSGPSQDNKG